MILFKGYYATKGKTYEEWHAGIHMFYKVFNAKLFHRDGRILVASTKTRIECEDYLFKITEFVTSNTQSYFQIEDCKLNVYRENNLLYQELTIIDESTIVDEYGIIYTYKSFVNE